MSGLKRWIAAIVILLLVAGYLQFGDMLSGNGCLSRYVIPTTQLGGAVTSFTTSQGIPASEITQVRYANADGKFYAVISLSNGTQVVGEFCMTGNPENPTPTLKES